MSDRAQMSFRNVDKNTAQEMEAKARQMAAEIIDQAEAFVIVAKVEGRVRSFGHCNLNDMPGVINALNGVSTIMQGNFERGKEIRSEGG